MRRLALLAGLSLGAMSAACTDVSTDPNTVVAIRFDGSAYPSIVAGDSLRDSLGALQPLRVTGLNYRGDSVASAKFVFSSPDTVLKMFADGNVFAIARKSDGNPARVYATVGSLQSQPDSIFTVPRADSIAPVAEADTVAAASVSDEQNFTVFGDTVPGKPKLAVQGWLVSLRLRYRGVLLAPGDTTLAYTTIVTTTSPPRRLVSTLDTTDASGRAGRKVFLRAPRPPEDTVFVVATIRQRKTGSQPLSAETRLIYRPGASTTIRVPSP